MGRVTFVLAFLALGCMATTCLENCQSFCLTLDADVETCNVNCAERLCPAEEAIAEVAPEPTPVPAVEVAENNNDFIYGFIVFLMCLFAFTIVVAVTALYQEREAVKYYWNAICVEFRKKFGKQKHEELDYLLYTG